MRYNEGRPVGMTAYELSIMLNRPVSTEEAEILRYQYGSVPDFGFVLEKYWEVAGRIERLEFNRLFMQILQQEFPLSIAKESSFCRMDVSVTQQAYEASSYKADLPQPRRFNATAETARSADEDEQTKPISSRYIMQQGATSWGISELYLNNLPLKATYGGTFQQAIRKGGFKNLFSQMQERIAQNKKPR